MAGRQVAFVSGLASAVLFAVTGLLLSQGKPDSVEIAQFTNGLAFGALALCVAFGVRGR